ncbi:pyridoxamine 5'-phosphate oxidase family protein [Candidatus Woesearchaeota archaeon]|nr:pyridoxamine 5'-phosphate oxidase family protein [Candidatus Woesearchaeota archaeon]
MGTILNNVEINTGMKKLIEGNALALATVNEKNEPHNIAVGFVKVISKNQLLISNNWLVETIENIRKNPNVSLVVWARNWEENCVGYEFRGKAEEFASGRWLEEIKKIPINKGEPCKSAIVVTINKIKLLD